ncbi:hypothetical protein MLD52_23135, partial [Puniceicoccaceae bacterium K14]|nr:hypothetical protein [Puniceicoccaceae bacterium K14]
AYDELRQLSSVNGNLAEAYLYDLSGNRLTADIGATNLVYEPNGLNQYTSIELDGEVTPFEPSYDLNGSQLQSRSRGSGEVSQYTWDESNRLASVEVGDHTQVSFHYDGLGRRVRKDVSTWDSSLSLFTLQTSHFYLFDGLQVLAEFEETVSSGEIEVTTYTRGLDIAQSLDATNGIGALLAVRQGD